MGDNFWRKGSIEWKFEHIVMVTREGNMVQHTPISTNKLIKTGMLQIMLQEGHDDGIFVRRDNQKTIYTLCTARLAVQMD